MPENREAWELVLSCQTQLRVSMGGIIGFDYGAVEYVADVLGIEMTPGTLRKIRAIEMELVKKVEKDGNS